MKKAKMRQARDEAWDAYYDAEDEVLRLTAAVERLRAMGVGEYWREQAAAAENDYQALHAKLDAARAAWVRFRHWCDPSDPQHEAWSWVPNALSGGVRARPRAGMVACGRDRTRTVDHADG